MPDDCADSPLTAAIDCARACLADLCVTGYMEPVVVRTRTWTGAMGASASTYVDVDVELDPRPRVAPVPPQHRSSAAGWAPDSTRRVTGVSLTYTRADLRVDALGSGVERWYLLDGIPYNLVSEPIKTATGWTFDLRRREGRAP